MSDISDPVAVQRQEALEVKQTASTRGWDIIVRDFTESSKELTNQLLEAHDIGEVCRLQAMIKAHQLFFDTALKHLSVSTD